MPSIDWKQVKRKKLPVVDNKSYYSTLEGETITWTSRDSGKAMAYLSKVAMKTNKVGLIDPTQGRSSSSNYHVNQIELAEKDHDWKFPMAIQIKGLNNSSKWISLSHDQIKKIKEIFRDN